VKHARRQVRRHRPHASVVFIGAGDTEPLTTAGGRRVMCCQRAWIDAYADRVEQMMRRPHAATKLASGYWSESRSGPRKFLWLAALIGILYLLIPVIVVIGLSFSSANYLQFPPRGLSMRWFNAFFQSPEWVGAAGRSVVVAVVTTAIVVILGTAVAYGMERGRVRYQRAHYLLLLSPLPMRLLPMYIEYFGVVKAMEMVKNEPGSAQKSSSRHWESFWI